MKQITPYFQISFSVLVLTPTHHCRPKSGVYIALQCWCCTCGFGQESTVIVVQKSFTDLRTTALSPSPSPGNHCPSDQLHSFASSKMSYLVGIILYVHSLFRLASFTEKQALFSTCFHRSMAHRLLEPSSVPLCGWTTSYPPLPSWVVLASKCGGYKRSFHQCSQAGFCVNRVVKVLGQVPQSPTANPAGRVGWALSETWAASNLARSWGCTSSLALAVVGAPGVCHSSRCMSTVLADLS